MLRASSSANTRAFHRAQIGDAGREHERQLLHFRSAGVMDHPSVGHRERALEADRREAFDCAGDRGHDLRPAIGTGAPDGAAPIGSSPKRISQAAGERPLRFTYSARWMAAMRDCGPTSSSIAMPASMKTPSSTFVDRFRGGLQSKAIGAVGPGEYQRQPGGSVLQIVQRLRVGLCRIRMIDPLHDLPGPRPGRGRRSETRLARADRSGRSSGRHRSCRPASRTARPSARHRPACASRHSSRARNPLPAGRSSVTDVIRQVAPSSRLSLVGRKLPRAEPPSQTVVFGLKGRLLVSRGRLAAQFPGSIAGPARP